MSEASTKSIPALKWESERITPSWSRPYLKHTATSDEGVAFHVSSSDHMYAVAKWSGHTIHLADAYDWRPSTVKEAKQMAQEFRLATWKERELERMRKRLQQDEAGVASRKNGIAELEALDITPKGTP